MQVYKQDFILLSFFFLASFLVQAKNSKDFITSENEKPMLSKSYMMEVRGQDLFHMLQQVEGDLLNIKRVVVCNGRK